MAIPIQELEDSCTRTCRTTQEILGSDVMNRLVFRVVQRIVFKRPASKWNMREISSFHGLQIWTSQRLLSHHVIEFLRYGKSVITSRYGVGWVCCVHVLLLLVGVSSTAVLWTSQRWQHAPALAFPWACVKMHELTTSGIHDAERQQVPTPNVVFLKDALRELQLGDEMAGQHQARVITEARPPYRILNVNQAMLQLCGYHREEVVGNTFGIMQGASTNGRSLAELGEALTAGRPTAQLLLNYKKSGEPFLNFVQVRKLVVCQYACALCLRGKV